MPKEPSAARSLGVAMIPAILAALMMSGSSGVRDSPLVALALGVAMAPVAGWLGARTPSDRVLASVTAMSGALGGVLAMAWRVRGSAPAGDTELLIRFFAGMLPSVALFFGFRALASAPLLRWLIAALVVIAAIVVTTW